MDDNEQLDFRELLGIVRRHIRSIVLISLVFLVLGVALVYQRSAVYSSEVKVTVRATTSDPTEASSLMDTMATEVSMPRSTQILGSVAQELGVPQDDLLKRVNATNTTGTAILDITCTAPTAKIARDCAEDVANAYIDDRQETAKKIHDARVAQISAGLQDLERRANAGDAEAQIQVGNIQAQLAALPVLQIPPATISQHATVPEAPTNKGFITTGLLFGFVGFILGIVLALVRERLKDPVLDRERMAASLGAPSLGIVPKLSRWRGRRDPRPVLMRAPDSPASQAYKAARSTLLHAAASRPLQVVAVVGPGLGDGKTTTTANLAVALAQSGKNVVAVSCDLARPRLHVLFGASNNLGLADVLTGHAALADAIQPTTEPGLSVIASGRVTDIAPEVLVGSDQMEEALETLRSQFDLVLLDTAPALLVADPLYLAPLTDGVVVVADATRTSRREVDEMRDTFERVGAWIIGGIVNRAVMKKARYLSRESRATRDPRTQARTPAPSWPNQGNFT
jgi:capsular exopolysaccharide synthesis family protein